MSFRDRIKNKELRSKDSPPRAGARLGEVSFRPKINIFWGLVILAIAIGVFWRTNLSTPNSITPSLSPPHEGEKRSHPDVPTTTLLAVGDIMLSRNVSTKIEQAKNPDLPFEKLIPELSSADIAFGNLECPLSDSQVPIREGLVFRCLVRNFGGVINSGFDVLSTANNHSFDQGSDNIDFTIDYLRSKNILPVGTFRSDSPPHEEGLGEVIGRHGIRFGFLAYSYSARNDGRNTIDPQIATMNIDQLKSDILNLKSQGADVIIVNMHAGTEYTRHPNEHQIDFAHATIDAGADIVIGHHPHWIQEIEIYESPHLTSPTSGEQQIKLFPPLDGEGKGGVNNPHKGLIFYSLGNFVFDQMWSQETREGLMVRLTFRGKTLDSAELIPVVIDNSCCPRLATETEKTKILKKINQETSTLNFGP